MLFDQMVTYSQMALLVRNLSSTRAAAGEGLAGRMARLHGLCMACPAGADAVVVGRGVVAAGVADRGLDDARDALVRQLQAPEAAALVTARTWRSALTGTC